METLPREIEVHILELVRLMNENEARKYWISIYNFEYNLYERVNRGYFLFLVIRCARKKHLYKNMLKD